MKKLLALAVASACAAPLLASAQASGVTLFGRVQAEYASIDVDRAAGAEDYRQEVITDNFGQSRWGLAIKEDLGGGLTANARVEFAFRTGTGSADAAREQWVGLSGANWGSVQFGRVHSPFKDFAGGTTLDPLNATALQLRGSGGASYTPGNGFGAGAFVDHAVRYTSPSWSGFSLAVLAMPSDASQAAAGTGGNTGGKGNGIDWQLAGKYAFSMGEVFAGYSNDKANDAQSAVVTNGKNGDDETVWRIGAKLKFGDLGVFGQYDDISDALLGGGTSCGGGATGTGNEAAATGQCLTALNTNGDGSIWNLGVNYKLGNTLLILQGGQTTADGVGTQPEREATNITVGAIYSLSKRSSVFGGYQQVRVDDAASVSSLGGTGTVAIDPDRSTWSIGMRHNF